MRYRTTHITEYDYQDIVSLCYNEAHLLPISTRYQTCFKRLLKIKPEPAYYHERHDYFGNQTSFFCIQEPHQKLSVTTSSEIEVLNRQLPELNDSLPWELVLQQMNSPATDNALKAKEYCFDSPMITTTNEIREYSKTSFTPNRPFLEAVYELMNRIYEDFEYDSGFSSISTPLEDVLKHKRGVCQDFAHLGIACIRAMGLPACYISGYLETLPPPGKPRLVGADASHAWFSVYDPNMGWVEFDPTNNQIPLKQYINVAYGRDYNDVTPLRGVLFGGGNNQLKVSVDVEPITPKENTQIQQQSRAVDETTQTQQQSMYNQ